MGSKRVGGEAINGNLHPSESEEAGIEQMGWDNVVNGGVTEERSGAMRAVEPVVGVWLEDIQAHPVEFINPKPTAWLCRLGSSCSVHGGGVCRRARLVMAGEVRLGRVSCSVTGLPSNLAPVWSSLERSSAINRLRASAF